MTFPDRETVKQPREEYPAGTRVILERMDDVQAPPAGTVGTVLGVDDGGSLLMKWDNGSSLNVIPGVDQVTKLIMTDTIYRQLMDIRNSAESNMFDYPVVQRLAYEKEYYELVMYVECHKTEYLNFILCGREEQ